MIIRYIGWILCFLCCSTLAFHENLPSNNFGPQAITTSRYISYRSLLQSGDQLCDNESGTSWHTCLHLGCGVNVESDVYESIKEATCSFNEIRRMWDCREISVDPYTHDALVNGNCTQACQPEKLACEIFSRLETPNNVPIPLSECRDGHVTLDFNCDCNIVTRTEMLDYARGLDGSQGGCSAICSDLDRDLSNCVVERPKSGRKDSRERCEDMICLRDNCAAQITRTAVDIIIQNTCTFSLVTHMWTCEGGLEIDDPGYQWAKFGNCVDACTITFRPDGCLFQARYGQHPDPIKKEKKRKKKSRKQDEKERSSGKVKPRKISKTDDQEEDQEVSKGKVEMNEDEMRSVEPEEEPPAIDELVIVEAETKSTEDSEDDADTHYEEHFHHEVATDSESAKETDTDPSSSLTSAPITETPGAPIGSPHVLSEAIHRDPSDSGSVVRPVTERIELESGGASSLPPNRGVESYAAPWMPCRQSCDDPTFGINAQERFVVCRSTFTGLPVTRDQCSSIDLTTEARECPPEVTQEYCSGSLVYKYQDWSECSSSDREADSCSRHRSCDCYERLNDGSLFPMAPSHCASLTKDVRRIACDPRQCEHVIYIPSEWSACDCDQSIARRNLKCSYVDDPDRRVNLSTCESVGLTRPETTRNCTCDRQAHNARSLKQMPETCGERSCHGNGVCRDGVCICDPPYQGPECDVSAEVAIEEDLTCDGGLRVEGVCCPSGIYDRNYNCCSRNATIDRDGNCCSGRLDACGVCNGAATFVDAYGTCCETTLDANGFCCQSGNVDECGVCDGFGMTCDFRLTFAITPPESAFAIDDRCVENLVGSVINLKQNVQNPIVRYAIEDDLTVLVSGSLIEFDRTIQSVSRTIQESLANADADVIGCGGSSFQLISVDRQSVGRNGICEVGETIFIATSSFTGHFAPEIDWTGIDDCFFVIAACPTTSDHGSAIVQADRPCSGNGICSFAGTAACTCYAGYDGDACDHCRTGYHAINGHCLPVGSPEHALAIERSNGHLIAEATQEENGRQFRVLLTTLGAIVILIILFVGVAAYLGWSRHNMEINIPSTGVHPSDMGSSIRSLNSTMGTQELTITATSIRTASSGTPIGGKIEPEEVIATPPRNVSERVDGSDFHGNRMHRPILPSSSSGPSTSYPRNAISHCTVDISGKKRQARRMPSPEPEVYSPLFPIQEGSPVNYSEASSEENTSPRHVRRASKSLDESNTAMLHSFEAWIDLPESQKQQRITPPGTPK